MSSAYPTWNFTDGSEIPVGTLYCIGRNYALHALEMGASVPEDPLVFLKPPAAYVPNGSIITLPNWSQEIHYEVELVVVIGKDIDATSTANPWETVAGIGVGVDLTARDIQSAAKNSGSPWAVSKGWYGSAPVSALIPIESSDERSWELQLFINGKLRQQESTSKMERSVEELIRYVSSVFTLRKGDAIFTGTPSGVGPVKRGDKLTANLSSLVSLRVEFA